MDWRIYRSAVILCILALCSCKSTVSPISSADSKVTAQVSPTPNGVRPISTDVISNPTKSATSSVLTPPSTTPTASLRCTTYIETRWGTQPGELGFCQNDEGEYYGPYPPKLNEQGDVFIADQANKRILRYSGNAAPYVIPIPSSYVFYPDNMCEYPSQWPNVSARGNRLFLRFPVARSGWGIVDQLAVLSVEGYEERVIDLSPYSPLRSPFLESLITDGKGGVYLLLPPAGIVHFDAEFRSEFYYPGNDPLFYTNLVVGWDNNIYTYNPGQDSLANWGTDSRHFMRMESPGGLTNVMSGTQISSPTYPHLMGVDAKGQSYFDVGQTSKDFRLVRISASGKRSIVAAVPAEWFPPSYRFALAPDGSLYGLVYDPKDPSVKPKIVKCEFPSD